MIEPCLFMRTIAWQPKCVKGYKYTELLSMITDEILPRSTEFVNFYLKGVSQYL